MNVPIALAAVALALLLPATASAVERTVTVKGSATQQVPNDAAKLGFSVSKERKSRGAALRIVAIRLRAVIAAVQATPGIGPGDVTTSEISIRKTSRGKHTVFRASEGIGVVLHQPERAGELVNAAVAAGATSARGPDFFPSNPETAYNNTLLAAFDQAKAKGSSPGHPSRRHPRPSNHDRRIHRSGPSRRPRQSQGSSRRSAGPASQARRLHSHRHRPRSFRSGIAPVAAGGAVLGDRPRRRRSRPRRMVAPKRRQDPPRLALNQSLEVRPSTSVRNVF